MQRINKKRAAGNLASLTLGIALCASATDAQGQGRRGGGGGQQGQGRGSAMGQGMRPQNGQNQANGQMFSPMGQGGMNRGGGNQMPGIRGTIVAGDINTAQILIESPQDGTQQIIQVTEETKIFTKPPASDPTSQTTTNTTTQTQGRMRGNAYSAGTMGQRPTPPQDGSSNQPRRGGQGGGQRGMQSSGNMSQPLTNGDGSMPPPPLEMNLQQLAFTELKVGDRLMAMGQMNSSGVFVATRIGVNMDMGKGQGGQRGQGRMSDQQNGMRQGGGGGRGGMGRPGQGQSGNGMNSRAASGMRPGGRPR